MNTLLLSLAIWESNEQYIFLLQLYLTSMPAHGHETAFSNSLLVMAHMPPAHKWFTMSPPSTLRTL